MCKGFASGEKKKKKAPISASVLHYKQDIFININENSTERQRRERNIWFWNKKVNEKKGTFKIKHLNQVKILKYIPMKTTKKATKVKYKVKLGKEQKENAWSKHRFTTGDKEVEAK